jgi:hypothetical protein
MSRMSPPVAVDENEAVLSLLGLQSAPSAGGTPFMNETEGGEAASPAVASPQDTQGSKRPASAYSDDDGSDAVRSPVYASLPRGLPEGSDSSEDDAQKLTKLPPPKAVSPVPEHRKSTSEMLLKPICKKRKHHHVVEGQFEDAPELSFPTHAMLHSGSNNQGVGGTENASMQLSGPSQPHSIHQASNDFLSMPSNLSYMANMPRLANSSSISVEDKFRQFLFMQQQQLQQRSMIQEGAFSNPYFAAMMANPGSTNSARPGECSFDQQRLQRDAMMAFQAQMAFATLQHQGGGTKSNLTTMNPLRKQSPCNSPAGGAVGENIAAATLVSLPAVSSATVSSSVKAAMSLSSSATGPSNTLTMDIAENSLARHPPAAVAAITAAVAEESVNTTPKRRRHHSALAMQPPPASQKTGHNSESDELGCSTKLSKEQPKARGPNGISTKVRFQKYNPPVSWRELAQVPKMPAVEPDNEQLNLITILQEHDVLLGRGGLTNTNPGNVRFRTLVSKHRLHYCMAPKGDKGALSRYLANYVRAMGGRFLAKASKADDCWYEVGDDQATKKCAQALREGTAEFNRKEQELS